MAMGVNYCLELLKIHKSEIFMCDVHRLWKKTEVKFSQKSKLIIIPGVP